MLPEKISEHGRAMRWFRVFLTPIGNGQMEIFHRLTPCQSPSKPHGLEGRLPDIKPDTFSNHRRPYSRTRCVSFMWFVLFISLDLSNQINETNQITVFSC
jgi:hypothetical protein